MKKISIQLISVFTLLLFCMTISAQQIHIPEDLLTIQEGIDRAVDGDTVLVFPGEYFENLNLKGKNIVLASTFIISGDLDVINQTIINGSQPVYPDTASCVLIISGEDRNCVIAGFTLTGGTGTKWEDEHNRGFWYTEGGGILIQSSSPTIRNNIIRDNEAINKRGSIVSAGGGAIRMGDSNPRILNNYIHHNKGLYGAGLVLNYAGAIIRNNIISNNSGGQDYGGGGVWILGGSPDPKILENNTIMNNSATNMGGGIRIWNTTAILTNNIIRGNHANSGAQVHGTGTISYCNIDGGLSGEGNIDENPRFTDPLFLLPDNSLSIDAGNPHTSYNDREDTANPGSPKYPSKGTLRNDMGVYGGPGAQAFPPVDLSDISELPLVNESYFKMYPNPASDYLNLEFSANLEIPLLLEITNIAGQNIIREELNDVYATYSVCLNDAGFIPGIYFIKLISANKALTQLLEIL